MSRSPEKPFGPTTGSMGDWLLDLGKKVHIGKPLPKDEAATIDLPETIQPIVVKKVVSPK